MKQSNNIIRRGGRVVEGARLESVYTSKGYRGFESRSLRLRKIPKSKIQIPTQIRVKNRIKLEFGICFLEFARSAHTKKRLKSI